jgi:hypothetical protein
MSSERSTYQQLLRKDELRQSRAAFYALYLRWTLGLAEDEARYWLLERYPGVRIPELPVKRGESNADHTELTDCDR